jgi:hypothetical protein
MASKRKQHNCEKKMHMSCLKFIPRQWRMIFVSALLCTILLTVSSVAEECKMGSDLDQATKSALESTAQRYFQMAASGDTNNLRSNSIPDVANNFSGIESVVAENKANFGTGSSVRGTYELDAPGNGPITRAEFYCGIFNSADRVGFFLNNLPAGRYGLVIMDANGGKVPMTVSMILQQMASQQWKLGGFYARPTSLAGHDAQWYLNQARQYKAKGQNHNAWFYYLAGWDLTAPVPFMSTTQLDKISDEMQTAKPADLPGQQQPLSLSSAGKSYSVTQLFAVPVQDGLGLVVKYQVPDVSNTSQAFADNMAVIKGLVAKYPEFRDAFSSVVARAVAPSGQDYGTLLAMKDVK